MTMGGGQEGRVASNYGASIIHGCAQVQCVQLPRWSTTPLGDIHVLCVLCSAVLVPHRLS